MFGRGKRRPRTLGILSAVIFNLSLFSIPFMAINLWKTAQKADLYGYDLTDAAKAQTRSALEQAAAELIPVGSDRKAYWSSLVQREIDENDFSAAKGFLLSAPKMLPPEDQARLASQLPPNADDNAIANAALVFLDEDVQRRYTAGSSALGTATRGAKDAIQGAISGKAENAGQLAGAVASDFFVLGDIRDLTIQSSNWVQNKPVDVFILTLSGVGIALTATTIVTAGGDAPVKVGASVLKAAKRSGKLTAKFLGHIERRVFEAIPPTRLKQNLTSSLSAGEATADESSAVVRAFENSVDPAGYKRLTEDLDEIKGISDAVSPMGAVRLLEHAEDATDLKRLRLVAESGGDRAIAVAKRGGGLKLLKAAKGTLKMTKRLTVDLAGLGLALFGLVLSTLATLFQVLLRAWHGGGDRRDHEKPAELSV